MQFHTSSQKSGKPCPLVAGFLCASLCKDVFFLGLPALKIDKFLFSANSPYICVNL